MYCVPVSPPKNCSCVNFQFEKHLRLSCGGHRLTEETSQMLCRGATLVHSAFASNGFAEIVAKQDHQVRQRNGPITAKLILPWRDPAQKAGFGEQVYEVGMGQALAPSFTA